MHFLGAAGGKGGVLAVPFGWDSFPHEFKALLNVVHGLKPPHVDQPAALHPLPHEHEVVAVHAFHEMLGRIDDEQV